MDRITDFYYNPNTKMNVRFKLTGEYHIKPASMVIHYIREIWSLDRSIKQFEEKRTYIEGAIKREEWKNTLLSTVIENGSHTAGDMFFDNVEAAILLREGLTEENRLV